MALKPHCIFQRGRSPIIAAAIHNGHQTRKCIEQRLAISEKDQLREEDPMTGEWAQIAETQIVGLRSRFEVDLNRPREKAVYRTPEDAWGMDIWTSPLDEAMVDVSLRQYDEFHSDVRSLLHEMLGAFPRLVVYDLHTYNQRRAGPNAPPAICSANPEVNVGTGTMDRIFWAPVIDRFIDELSAYDFQGRRLDVRENVKFHGGNFGRWIHETFPKRVCVISIEFKKFFMDEWRGVPDFEKVESIYSALKSTLPGVYTALESM